MDVNELHSILAKHSQQHLLKFWDKLTDDQKQILYNDLKSVNYSEVLNIFHQTTKLTDDGNTSLDDFLEPLSENVHQGVTTSSDEQLQQYRREGLKQISEGRVAALLLAGGQGTRLGVNCPKGMVDVGLPSKKTLYQLQGERLRRLEQVAFMSTGKRGNIPWYIMTSECTKEPTEDFFIEHDYFGLQKENLVIFEQNTLPCFTLDGKLILEKTYRLARSPDGNGGLYNALRDCRILDDMERRGIEYVQVYCVDNILVKIADPTFIGYCVTKNAQAGAKVVAKSSPTEAVGIICKVKGIYEVVEYSEVSLHTAEKQNPDGRLTFSAGNICNHFFTLKFLKKVTSGKQLKHHIAKKKIPYVNEDGVLVKPDKVNGLKLEKFVFDVFQFTDKFAVWEVFREDEFSPLKNADGAEKDTPTTARESLFSLHKEYIAKAGGLLCDGNGLILSSDSMINEKHSVNGTNGIKASNGTSDLNGYNEQDVKSSVFVCEISPLVSYDGEDLEELVGGKKLKSPVVLRSSDEYNGSNVHTNGTH